MWIFLKDAFFSITRAPEQGNLLLVRARFRGDIERYFPEADVLKSAGTDYRFRTLIAHEQVLEALQSKFQEIDYADFSGTVLASEKRRGEYYKSVLWTLRNSQSFSTLIEEA